MAARKYTYYPWGAGAVPSGAAASIVLGDDAAGEFISVVSPVEQRAVQEFHPLRGDYALRFNRGGRGTEISWTVDRDHATIAAASLFRRTHPAAVPHPLGEVTGILAETGDDGVVLYLQRFTLTRISLARYVGRSTLFEYTGIGSQWTATLNA